MSLKERFVSWFDRVRGYTDETRPVRLSRTQRDEAIQSLQHGYTEVLDLMSSVRNHLDQQALRSDRLLDQLDGLPHAIQSLPESNRNQARMLEAIEGHLDSQHRAAREMNESMAGLARSADSQVQIMTALQQQFEQRTETDRQMVKSFSTINETLIQLNRSSESSLLFLQQLAERSDRTHEEMSQIVRRNRIHNTVLAGTTCSVLILAIASIAFFFFNQPPTTDTETIVQTPAPDTSYQPVSLPSTPAPSSEEMIHPLTPTTNATSEPEATSTVEAEPDAVADTLPTDPADPADLTATSADPPLTIIPDAAPASDPDEGSFLPATLDELINPLPKNNDASLSPTLQPVPAE